MFKELLKQIDIAMLNDKKTIERNLGKEYLNHVIFAEIDEYMTFYGRLSHSISHWFSMGTSAITNLDTYVFSSLEGTLESINLILKAGRMNDSYALLRKYYDATMINIYSNLFLDDNFSAQNLIVKQIEDWKNGSETIPEYRVIARYIKNSPKLESITVLLQTDDRYKKIRDRCNDHMHYNFYRHLMYNDNKVYLGDRVDLLNTLSKDLKDLFTQHISYLFYLKEHYMMSSDYIDALEVGVEPEEEAQYFVAPFVQEIFDNVVKEYRPDIAQLIKKETAMELQ